MKPRLARKSAVEKTLVDFDRTFEPGPRSSTLDREAQVEQANGNLANEANWQRAGIARTGIEEGRGVRRF
jgi:hypothetical protein